MDTVQLDFTSEKVLMLKIVDIGQKFGQSSERKWLIKDICKWKEKRVRITRLANDVWKKLFPGDWISLNIKIMATMSLSSKGMAIMTASFK